MKTRYFLILLLFAILNNSFFSQTYNPGIDVQGSSLLVGAGQTGVSFPSNEVFGYCFNPAILGYAAKENHISYSILPKEVTWFGSESQTYSNYGFNIGYNMGNKYKDLPITIGFGFRNSATNIGFDVFPSEYPSNDHIACFRGKNTITSYSLGVGLDYYISLYLGFSIKQLNFRIENAFLHIYDEDKSTCISTSYDYLNAKGNTIDYGAIILLPVSKLLFPEIRFTLNQNSFIKPSIDLSLGCSILNYGDNPLFANMKVKFPYLLERYSKLGYTFRFGLDMNLNGNEFELLKYSYTCEATDFLSRYTGTRGFYHRAPFKDINIWNNFFLLQSRFCSIVEVERAFYLNLFETVNLEYGYSCYEPSYGFGISTSGISKLLSRTFDSSLLNFIARHLSLDYQNSYAYYKIERIRTNIKELSIHFNNLFF